MGHIKVFRIRKITLYKLNYIELIEKKPLLKTDIELIDKDNYTRIDELRNGLSESFKRMLDSNQIGIYAKIDNKIVGHGWAERYVKNNEIKNTLFKLTSNTCMLHFCYVKDEYRGNNIYPFILTSIIKEINRDYGIDTFYICADKDNTSSQKGLNKVGFKLSNEYVFFYMFNRIINRKELS